MSEPEHFGMQPGWELGPEHVLPGTTTGLSPLNDAGWRQMLEGMQWDGPPIGPESSWRGTPTSAHGT